MALASYEYNSGKHHLALQHMDHVLKLWRIVYGNDHPDLTQFDTNASAMLRAVGQHAKAVEFARRAHRTLTTLLGDKHPATIHGAQVLVTALFSAEEYKEAVGVQKSVYSFMMDKHGVDHDETKQADVILNALTSNAVQATRKALPEKTTRLSTNSISKEPATTTSLIGSMGNLSIDELLTYIEGTPKKGPKRRAKK
jgi:protein TIF31